MTKEWQLPPAFESDRYKSFLIAESVIEDFAQDRFTPPVVLVKSVTEYFCTKDDAKIALKRFTTQLGGFNEDFDASDDPRIQAALAIGIVTVWASSETENRYAAFRDLVQNSWCVENLWTEVALVVALKNVVFKEALLNLAEQHFVDAEKKLHQAYSDDPSNPTTLDDIWYGHARESRDDESSWPWIELLAKLDPNKLFEWMNTTQSLLLINRVLGSPEFYRNYDLWEQFTLKSPPSFQNDGTWNGALLLPSLLRHGSMKIIHIAEGHGYSPSMLEQHVKSLFACFVDTIAKRSDFEGLFKRWGTWLTLQHLNFPDNNLNQKRPLGGQDILWALADKLPLPCSPTVSEQMNFSWEPWFYQSMLALLHSNEPDRFPAPDVRAFIKEWNLTPTEWNSSKGKSLRSHVSKYHVTNPNNFACRVLGYSVALSDDFTSHWLSMWNSSVALREILEFRPIYKISKEWQPSDASGLMRTLVDVGLGILDCTVNAQETLTPEILKQSATLFQALWEATTEMLNIDIYGNDFWPIMQQHLVIRRLRWTVEAKNSNDDHYSKCLDQAVYPRSREILSFVSSNYCSFISLLPLLVQNQIPKQTLKDLIAQADIDLVSLATSATRYQRGPKMKFKIYPHHVKLIEELARI
ncbi:hypothetical protein KFV96_03280 [Klebsiella pneumoniae]|uniref:hypothetical protein n=1 Tax=Enterobacteriaceae TaxID=543 RepID=UPI001B8B9D58|nr:MULTISPECIES: hypothetical protein [Enterobacteriaceae]HCL5922752.1 hypothetical protein [Citrobacter amalonaticus]MBS2900178.1 hypothetical protein [Klebsiella pneumoniae]MBS2916268.1 hypothetical protein [Klebsiella pneumoniae]MDN4386734.1 hypothetical protein [Citrobacter portucalensis]MDN4406855.1 hypothetical protein [Citrobacter portucalensis]